ncbi:SCO6745 family protein [Nocardioides panacisoli]
MGRERVGGARVLWRLLEPVHAVTYFSPEPLAALKAAGYRGFWMGYFAGRAAPLGATGPELVHALFYNFTFDHVARALPDAWGFAPPEAALAARSEGSVAALRRHLGEQASAPEIERAAEIAARAAAAAPLEGRPLFAANRSLPEPDEPLARLWHAATLLREHRGDGHVATLLAAGIGGRAAHVFHAIASGTPADTYAAARHLGPDEWDALVAGLRERGYVDDAGTLTDAGRAAKRDVEDRTDAAAWSAYEQLDDAELDALVAALRPVTAAVVAAGEIPVRSPMGLDLSS